MNMNALKSTVLLFLAAGFFFLSCKKEARNLQQRDGKSTFFSHSNLTATPNVYSVRTITFDHPTGVYTTAQAVSDFGNITSGWNESRAYLTTNQCQVKVLKNALSSASGIIANIDITDAPEYTVAFKIKFHSDFEWCTGGKIGVGLFIGDGAAGGSGTDGNGGSLRLVWHKNPNTGLVCFQAYAYHYDQPGIYGDSFGKYPASGTLNKNQWYTIKLYAKSNTGTSTNGRLKFYVDGNLVIDRSMRWTTSDAKRLINRMEFATFRGGATADYESDTDSYIYYNDLSWVNSEN